MFLSCFAQTIVPDMSPEVDESKSIVLQSELYDLKLPCNNGSKS